MNQHDDAFARTNGHTQFHTDRSTRRLNTSIGRHQQRVDHIPTLLTWIDRLNDRPIDGMGWALQCTALTP